MSAEQVEHDFLAAQRLGLFGGTFDPVHCGHLHVARTAFDAFDLDAIVFVPAARSPHKLDAKMASAEDRMAMLALALEGEPWFALSDMELRRGAPSFTIDTVLALTEQRSALKDSELFLVLGSDNLTGLDTWRDIDQIFQLAQPITIARKGTTLDDLAKLSAPSRERLERGFVNATPVEVSATELRGELRAGRSDSKLPGAVREYIESRGIYGEL